MTTDPFEARLSEYIDGSLPPNERDALEEHLMSCEACRQIVKELKSVLSAARRLPSISPPDHTWSRLSEAVRSHRSKKKRTHFQEGLAVAAAVVFGLSLWVSFRSFAPRPSDSDALARQVTDELQAAENHYQNAIEGLEKIIAENEGAMPKELSGTIMANLDLIDHAIEQSRTAVTAEPESPVAQESLLEAFRRKVDLLQSTILLINDLRKGEGRNALDRIEEIQRNQEPSSQL